MATTRRISAATKTIDGRTSHTFCFGTFRLWNNRSIGKSDGAFEVERKVSSMKSRNDYNHPLGECCFEPDTDGQEHERAISPAEDFEHNRRQRSSPVATLEDEDEGIRHHILSYHYVRSMIVRGFILMQHLAGKDNCADILTKHWGHSVVLYPLLKPIFHYCGNTGDLLQNDLSIS
eukprot:jgi/Psemu1/6997/gm1.6997_g